MSEQFAIDADGNICTFGNPRCPGATLIPGATNMAEAFEWVRQNRPAASRTPIVVAPAAPTVDAAQAALIAAAEEQVRRGLAIEAASEEKVSAVTGTPVAELRAAKAQQAKADAAPPVAEQSAPSKVCLGWVGPTKLRSNTDD